jgi:hypothetical protein
MEVKKQAMEYVKIFLNRIQYSTAKQEFYFKEKEYTQWIQE